MTTAPLFDPLNHGCRHCGAASGRRCEHEADRAPTRVAGRSRVEVEAHPSATDVVLALFLAAERTYTDGVRLVADDHLPVDRAVEGLPAIDGRRRPLAELRGMSLGLHAAATALLPTGPWFGWD